MILDNNYPDILLLTGTDYLDHFLMLYNRNPLHQEYCNYNEPEKIIKDKFLTNFNQLDIKNKVKYMNQYILTQINPYDFENSITNIDKECIELFFKLIKEYVLAKSHNPIAKVGELSPLSLIIVYATLYKDFNIFLYNVSIYWFNLWKERNLEIPENPRSQLIQQRSFTKRPVIHNIWSIIEWFEPSKKFTDSTLLNFRLTKRKWVEENKTTIETIERIHDPLKKHLEKQQSITKLKTKYSQFIYQEIAKQPLIFMYYYMINNTLDNSFMIKLKMEKTIIKENFNNKENIISKDDFKEIMNWDDKKFFMAFLNTHKKSLKEDEKLILKKLKNNHWNDFKKGFYLPTKYEK